MKVVKDGTGILEVKIELTYALSGWDIQAENTEAAGLKVTDELEKDANSSLRSLIGMMEECTDYHITSVKARAIEIEMEDLD